VAVDFLPITRVVEILFSPDCSGGGCVSPSSCAMEFLLCFRFFLSLFSRSGRLELSETLRHVLLRHVRRPFMKPPPQTPAVFQPPYAERGSHAPWATCA